MRSPRTRLVAALVAAPMIFLAGCSTNDTTPSATSGATASSSGDLGSAATSTGDLGSATSASAGDAGSATSADTAAATSAAPGADLSALAVTKKGGKPSLTWHGKPLAKGKLPFTVSATTAETVKPGKGTAVAEGDDVVVRYLAVNGKDGKQILSTFDQDETVTMALSNDRLIPAFTKELPGRKPGEAFLMAVPPADGFGPAGNANLNLGPKDTLLFYVEVVSSAKPLTEATGTAVKPKAGLPKVTADGKSAAKIDVKGVKPPTELVVQPLIKGDGPKVKAGQTIRVHYTGVSLKDGKQFDSSYSRNQPAEFQIGTGNVIKGWDEGLVGQTVGSRVLLVIPAKDAYGTEKGTNELGGQDLVFVVDILGAY